MLATLYRLTADKCSYRITGNGHAPVHTAPRLVHYAHGKYCKHSKCASCQSRACYTQQGKKKNVHMQQGDRKRSQSECLIFFSKSFICHPFSLQSLCAHKNIDIYIDFRTSKDIRPQTRRHVGPKLRVYYIAAISFSRGDNA